MLKNARLRPAGKQPKLRHNFQRILCKDHTPLPRVRPAADPIEKSLFFVWKLNFDRHILTKQLFERNISFVFRQNFEVKVKQLADSFVAAKANQKKLILAQGSLNRERPSILCVAHKFQGKGERVEGKRACAFGTFTP